MSSTRYARGLNNFALDLVNLLFASVLWVSQKMVVDVFFNVISLLFSCFALVYRFEKNA